MPEGIEEYKVGELVTHAVAGWDGVISMNFRNIGEHTLWTNHLTVRFMTEDGLKEFQCYPGELVRKNPQGKSP